MGVLLDLEEGVGVSGPAVGINLDMRRNGLPYGWYYLESVGYNDEVYSQEKKYWCCYKQSKFECK
jgi:hypothetical protein